MAKQDSETSITYFTEPGKSNSKKTLQAAARRARELDIDTIILPSTSGETGQLALELMDDREIVVVTHSTGFIRPDFQQMPESTRRKLQENGAKVLTCQHALGGVGRAVRKKMDTYQTDEIIAYTLRLFGEGTKVAIEITLMAADAGLVVTQTPCISLGGTGEGVDTALVIQPAHAQNFFDVKIMEIIAKPRLGMDSFET